MNRNRKKTTLFGSNNGLQRKYQVQVINFSILYTMVPKFLKT